MGGFENDLFDVNNYRLLQVVQSSFINVQSLTLEELFGFGQFDTLYAVTYSSDVCLMDKLFTNYKYSEVIFGWPKVINKQQRVLFDVPYDIIKHYIN